MIWPRSGIPTALPEIPGSSGRQQRSCRRSTAPTIFSLPTGKKQAPGNRRPAHPPPEPPQEAPAEAHPAPPHGAFQRKSRVKVAAVTVALALLIAALAFMGLKDRWRDTKTVTVPSEPVVSGNTTAPGTPAQEAKPRAGIKTVRPSTKAAPRSTFFTLGSSKDEVLAAQGEPLFTSETRWGYGSSYVDFQKGKVSGWQSSGLDPLHIRITGSRAGIAPYFTVGSTREQVAAVQGTPSQVSRERWSYGFSTVEFEKGKVVRWYSSNVEPLRVKMTPSTEPTDNEFFTIGSSKDEVLALQGTPTRLSDKRWGYGFSYVNFEKGKVTGWYNSDQDPLLIEKEE